ncbi:hypothetical protein GN956_G23791 [Arapaima gigas]
MRRATASGLKCPNLGHVAHEPRSEGGPHVLHSSFLPGTGLPDPQAAGWDNMDRMETELAAETTGKGTMLS